MHIANKCKHIGIGIGTGIRIEFCFIIPNPIENWIQRNIEDDKFVVTLRLTEMRQRFDKHAHTIFFNSLFTNFINQKITKCFLSFKPNTAKVPMSYTTIWNMIWAFILTTIQSVSNVIHVECWCDIKHICEYEYLLDFWFYLSNDFRYLRVSVAPFLA